MRAARRSSSGRTTPGSRCRGDGTIRSENGPVGQLRVVRFEDPQKLRAEGDRLFASDEPGVAAERPGVVQGAVEGSNVQPVLEITR